MSEERNKKIFSAYDKVGKLSLLYDEMLTGSGFFGRIALNFFWGLSKKSHAEFLNLATAGIPKNFSGRLLEIPVGTGILSFPTYKKIPNAEIFCLDYSESMLKAAREKIAELNLQNIKLLQGDVENLPFTSENFDLLLSLNGLHVFRDKFSAYREMNRVLKFGGIFCGCCYVKGENARTDFFVKNFCDRFGFFTPPHFTLTELENFLKKLYREVKISNVKSFAGFICQK